MAIINLKSNEIECKIVYYGPGRSGKTTNLEYIFRTYKKQVTDQLVSIDTEGDRTLFFDFLPMGVQLYTVPGQVQYSSTRKLVLKGADGIVFVADSFAIRRDKNILSLKDLDQNLKECGLNIFKIPLVLQYNKRDMSSLSDGSIPIMPVEIMQNDLNRQLKAPFFPASALTGEGVGKTLKESLKLTLLHLQREFKWAQK
jgi:mutual gliding-motility protein MglA